MPVPTTNDEHRVLTDYSCMAKSVEWLRAFSEDLLPLILLSFECAFPEVVVSNAAIIPCEHIYRSIVKYNRVICSLRWTVSDALDP